MNWKTQYEHLTKLYALKENKTKEDYEKVESMYKEGLISEKWFNYYKKSC